MHNISYAKVWYVLWSGSLPNNKKEAQSIALHSSQAVSSWHNTVWQRERLWKIVGILVMFYLQASRRAHILWNIQNPICEIHAKEHITYIALRFSLISALVLKWKENSSMLQHVLCKVITWLRQMLAPFDPYWNERLLTKSQRLSISINVYHHQWCTKEFIGWNHYSIYIIILLVLFYIVLTLLYTNIYFKKCSYNSVYYHTRKWDIRKDIKCRQKKAIQYQPNDSA